MSLTRSAAPQDLPIITLVLRNEADIVLVRQRARLISELLGFSRVDQTRNATAVSEIARNAVQHGGGGRIRYAISGAQPRALRITVEDGGAGLGAPRRGGSADRRASGGGLGVELSRRLMDRFELRPREEGGTVVEMVRLLPPARQATGATEIRSLVDELLRRPPESLIEELHQQQQELLGVLDDLTEQQERLQQMNAELEETNRGVMALHSQVTQELDDTNRGVVALYAQLDDQARELQRVSTLKDRFLSHLSHEFRTPLSSTLALARLLLDRADGPLSEEQERQLGFIYDGARELLGMVDDLLDLAKIEAGRLDVNPETFAVEELFSALRGMLRPLAAEKPVELVFAEVPTGFPQLQTDRQKLAQILRNLVSNALKFTEAGEVCVGLRAEDADTVVFEVRDTGIGIPPDQLERIFREFEQVAGPHQRGVQGTGLGLSLSARLAALLGGSIDARSTPGQGSAFRLRIPREAPARDATPAPPLPREAIRSPAPGTPRPHVPAPAQPAPDSATGPLVLLVDDDPAARYLVEHAIVPLGCTVAHAATGREALQRARELSPDAAVLDLGLPDMSGLDVLRELKADPALGDRPIIVFTTRKLSVDEASLLSDLDVRIVTKDDPKLQQTFGEFGAGLVRMMHRPRKGDVRDD